MMKSKLITKVTSSFEVGIYKSPTGGGGSYPEMLWAAIKMSKRYMRVLSMILLGSNWPWCL